MSTSKKFVGFLNFTPHVVTVLDDQSNTIAKFPSNGIARCSTSTVDDGNLGGIPMTKTRMGDIVGLPDPQNGVFIIVSRIVCAAAPDRDDLLIVDKTVRNDAGQIIGCRSFSLNPSLQ